MRMLPRLSVSCAYPIAAAALLCLGPLARAQSSTTVSAAAEVKSAGGVVATAPVSIVVERLSTAAERDEIMAALKSGGTEGVRRVLLTRAPIGTIKVGAQATVIKHAFERTTPDGRLITALSGSPIGFVGAAQPGAKPRTGFDLGLVILEVAASGPGRGTLVPAAKVRLDAQGALVTEDYGADVVQLSKVVVVK